MDPANSLLLGNVEEEFLAEDLIDGSEKGKDSVDGSRNGVEGSVKVDRKEVVGLNIRRVC